MGQRLSRAAGWLSELAHSTVVHMLLLLFTTLVFPCICGLPYDCESGCHSTVYGLDPTIFDSGLAMLWPPLRARF